MWSTGEPRLGIQEWKEDVPTLSDSEGEIKGSYRAKADEGNQGYTRKNKNREDWPAEKLSVEKFSSTLAVMSHGKVKQRREQVCCMSQTLEEV